MKPHRRLNEPMQSRAEPIDLRLAHGEEDGDVLRNLVAKSGWNLEHWYDQVDWSDLYPNWVVAEIDGLIVAGMQVTPGKPVGRLEMLCVEPELAPRSKARLVRGMIEYGFQVLRAQGSQVATAMIPHEMKSYKKALKKRGCEVVLTGNTLGLYIGESKPTVH